MPSISTPNVFSITGDRPGEGCGTRPALFERREPERAITYWKQRAVRLRHPPTLMTLDANEMSTHEWAHRFIFAIDTAVENWVPLIYGPKFAELLDLPANPFPDIPMIEQLPQRFAPLFTKGGSDAAANIGTQVRMEGTVRREDGRDELYRAVFIAFGVKPDSLTRLAFGAFSSCVRHRQL